MKSLNLKNQSGVALIVFVLMIMGVGGYLLVGYSQGLLKQVELSKTEHNTRVLIEAKQALLQYAYNYPQFNSEGPGRLPCPDDDNDGLTGALSLALCQSVGRLPWAELEMNFYDARDSDEERLWYAVSNQFYNLGGGPIINSDSVGSITLVDQSQNIIYYGDVAGIAAIIIAAGSAIARDEDDNGTYEYTQVRGTVGQQNDPRNYLDTFNGFVNDTFTNGESDTDDDGFILGPIRESDEASPAFNTIVVNDQMIVITAAEVIEVAEKATLQAYRTAIVDFWCADEIPPGSGTTQALCVANGGTWLGYPWLDPYNSADGLATFDAVVTPSAPNPVIGRLPSIFENYFDATNTLDSRLIKPELILSINIDTQVHNLVIPVPDPLTPEVFFRANGDLVSSIDNGYTITRYFWDGHPTQTPTLPLDNIWQVCPFVTDTEEDCNQDTAGNFIGGLVSIVWLRVRQVSITFAGGTPIEFLEADRTGSAVEYWMAPDPENPDGENHIYIAAEYDDNPSYISSFSYIQDDDFQSGFTEFPIGNNDNLTYDAGDTIKVGLPYYPTLPKWALDNGWHDSLMIAYSSAVQPGGDGVCNVGVDDCLTLQNSVGVINDKIALLILSGNEGDGDHLNTALIDEGGGPQYFSDDLGDIFEDENNTPDLVFDQRPANGNDVVFILE